MATYPNYPDAPRTNIPSSGNDSAAVAVAAGLPALASLIPGKWGGIIGALAGIPGSIMEYNKTKELTDLENANRGRAETMAEQWKPYVARPAEFNMDVRVPYIADAVKMRVAGDQATRRDEEDTAIRYGRGEYGEIAPSQMADVLTNVRRAGSERVQQGVAGLIDDARRAYIDNKMSIGQAELQRNSQNEALSGDRLKMMLEVLLQPYGQVSGTGVSDRLNNSLQFAQQLQLERDRISAQKWMTYKQVQAQRLSALTSLGGALGGAGINAAGANSAAQTLSNNNGTVAQQVQAQNVGQVDI